MAKILRPSSSWLVLAITVSFTFFYLSVLSYTSFVTAIRLRSVDALYTWRARHSPPLRHFKEVVVVGVDDVSYQRMDLAWPWSRAVFGNFLEKIQKFKPKAVGLDFLFVGKGTDPQADDRLSGAMGISKNVVTAAYFGENERYITPTEKIRDAAAGFGFVDKPLDKDLVNRHTRVVADLPRDGIAYSFSTQLVYLYYGLPVAEHVKLADDGNLTLELPSGQDPSSLQKDVFQTDPNSQLWISYRYRPDDFAYVPFWKVMDGRVSAKDFEGKTVLVGPVSPTFHDVHPTPLGIMAGAFINANEMLMLMDRDFIREWFPEWRWTLLLVLAFLSALVFYQFKYWLNFIILLAAELLIALGVIRLFVDKNLLLEPFSVMFIPLMSYLTVLTYKGLKTVLENIALQRMVITDGLTGLYAHRYLTMRLAAEFERFREQKAEFCFVMIDLDYFKKINDQYGHEAGNQVLVSIARFLKTGVRGSDIVARYGGEEFSILLPHCPDKAAAQTVDRIRKAIESQAFVTPQGVAYRVTISAGICSNQNPDVRSADDMTRLADQALYRAKSEGRNRVCIHQAQVAAKQAHA